MHRNRIAPWITFVTSDDDGGGGGAPAESGGGGNAERSAGERTFTQDELNAKVRDRVGRVQAKYADYDELKAAAAELAKIKDAQKSEAERVAEALETAQREAATARLEAARFRAAAEHGITGKYASLLSGSDVDELNQNAELLGELIAAKTAADAAATSADAAKETAKHRAGVLGQAARQAWPGATPTRVDGSPSAKELAIEAARARGWASRPQ